MDAVLQMQVSAGSLLGGNTNYGPVPFGSVRNAEDVAAHTLTAAAFKAAELFSANARLQNMMGQVKLLQPVASKFPATRTSSLWEELQDPI